MGASVIKGNFNKLVGFRHTLIKIIALLLLIISLLQGIITAAPLTGHPRLWITQSDLPRLRSWATSTNPMYKNATLPVLNEAIETYKTKFFPNGQPNPTFPDEGLTGSGNAYVTESYAEFFAFMSLVDPGASNRDTFATYAYNLIMYAFNQVYAKMNTSDQNWGNPMMAVYDRARWSGEAFPLTVDWIYNKFTNADKVKIQKVFLYWDNAINANYRSPIDHGLNGVPDELPGGRDATNNYYTGTFRNLVLHTLCLDSTDDPAVDQSKDPVKVWGNSLRSYIPYWQNRWMQQLYNQYGPGGAAEGGAHPEGPYYGIENMGFFRQAILALQTAGYNDKSVSGQYVQICDLPYWDGLIESTYKQMPYNPLPIADAPYLGDAYQIDSYGDNQHFFLTNLIELYGPMGIYDALKSNTKRLNMDKWLCFNGAPGGEKRFYDVASNIWPNNYASLAIFYFLLFDPSAAALTDPRQSLGLSFFAKGMGRMVDRTEWSANASIFSFISSFLTEGHQHGYSGMFAFNRKNEWLTKELTMYGADNKALASEFHNVLSIKNDNLPAAELNAEWWAQYIDERGGQWVYAGFNNGDPTLINSMQTSYDYAQTDLTNLYNNPHGCQDVKHASRSIVWLKPDIIVIYDRATTGKSGRFKKFNLWLPSNPVITGKQVSAMSTGGGQKLIVTSLQPAKAVLNVSPASAEQISFIAEAEPMKYKLVIEDTSKPADIRFLTVLQGMDKSTAAEATKEIQSSSGTAFSGVEVKNTSVLFLTDTKSIFSNVTFTVSSNVNRYIVTGLTPNGSYDAEVQNNTGGTQITVLPGTKYKADSGGVLDFGTGASLIRNSGTFTKGILGKPDGIFTVYDPLGRMVGQYHSDLSVSKTGNNSQMINKLPSGAYIISSGNTKQQNIRRIVHF